MFLLSRNNARTIAATISLLALCVAAHSQKRQLSQAEAVALAEQFVAQNGYTDLAPDKTKLSSETIEWESNVDRMLQERHGTLERRAYGIVRGRKGGSAGWTVVFRYTHPIDRHARSTGRALTMNLDGSEPRVEHVDFLLRYARKLR